MQSHEYQPGRRAVTRPVRMSQLEKTGHAVMIVCTLGLWLPVYWIRKARFKGVSVTTYE